MIHSEKTISEENIYTPLKINSSAESLLKSIAKWSQFIAVFNFVLIGFFIVITIIMIAMSTTLQEYQDFSGYPIAIMGISYLVMSVICIFPTYFLSAAAKIKKAFLQRDEDIQAKGFRNLKNLTLFTGILLIISIVIIVFSNYFNDPLFRNNSHYS